MAGSWRPAKKTQGCGAAGGRLQIEEL
ncbi:hypothetical protein HU200_003125 [Digitaria exilis]|uniref:Uncharacterized protein n=1 Tax=Digitaria exilis TaxID=1010633 RepID=A0A835FVA1_9POAL|nr:hypothetical protein HU200_003504 [Digitaria exilis]KAF8779019.1 hypothetical protein HU200_003125 [Digitaria exilis]